VDHKCPFTSDVSIRGRILTGTVRSAKMKRTIIIRRDYMHYIKKYQRCAPCPRSPSRRTGGLLRP
jgi:small subunit ribosomal protein S11e